MPHPLNKPLTPTSNPLESLAAYTLSCVDRPHPFTSTTTRP